MSPTQQQLLTLLSLCFLFSFIAADPVGFFHFNTHCQYHIARKMDVLTYV
jgi:hypothetical protein